MDNINKLHIELSQKNTVIVDLNTKVKHLEHEVHSLKYMLHTRPAVAAANKSPLMSECIYSPDTINPGYNATPSALVIERINEKAYGRNLNDK